MKKAHITCPYCHAPAQLRPASSIYGIHTKDRAAKLYVCSRYPACDAYVQAHKATGLPMGTLANKELRQKRMQAHRTFNQLWEKGLMRKQDAYAWLCVRLGLPEADAHIANFSESLRPGHIALQGIFERTKEGETKWIEAASY